MRNTFTTGDAAMLLVDHGVGTVKLAVSPPCDELLRDTRAPARTAVEAGMALVLTSSQEDRFQGLLLDDLRAIAPAVYAARVKRPGVVDGWMYEPFEAAVPATGRKKLSLAGLTNDVCIVFPAISDVEDGFEVRVAADAGGSPTEAAGDAAPNRRARHGGTLTSTNQLLAELATGWPSSGGSVSRRVLDEVNPRHLVEAPAPATIAA